MMEANCFTPAKITKINILDTAMKHVASPTFNKHDFQKILTVIAFASDCG